MFCQIFLSPQVKRWAIITYKHGIYELPHKLLNNLRPRIPTEETRKKQEKKTRKKQEKKPNKKKKTPRILGN